MKTKYLLAAIATMPMFFSFTANAQEEEEKQQKKGYLTGNFETNSIWYQSNDKATGAEAPDDKFGSNNYLKLDYYRGKFSAGVQLEGYLPVLQNFPTELKGIDLTNYYVTWQDERFNVTAGTFYDQFGSGLLFRSWEDRTLGLNNAVMGARFSYNFKDIVAVKAIWGMPRFGMKFSDTQVRGVDLSFSISELAKLQDITLSVEGSMLSRYEAISDDLKAEGGKPNNEGWSGRVNFETHGFSAKLEYVDAGKKYFSNPMISSESPNYFLQKHGNAQLVELGYNNKGLGISVIGRRLEWMESKITGGSNSTSNLLNYLPGICTQYTYMLTTLCPYNTQTGLLTSAYTNSGEIGGQIDAFYNFRRGTKLGGKRGMRIHANFSTYYALQGEGSAKAGNLLFRDFSVDIEKQFTRKYKLALLYSMQEFNHDYGKTKNTTLSHIIVADMLYKFTPMFSTRLELQYLHTKEYATVYSNEKGDWMAALLEANFAPSWSVWGSWMLNHGGTKVNYFNVGVSYAVSRTRIAIGYGRNKAGYLCSGGVCRPIDAYTGANFQITTSF